VGMQIRTRRGSLLRVDNLVVAQSLVVHRSRILLVWGYRTRQWRGSLLDKVVRVGMQIGTCQDSLLRPGDLAVAHYKIHQHAWLSR
jgi:hypothetical protein